MKHVPAAWLLALVAGLAAPVAPALATAAKPKPKPTTGGQINPAVQLQALSCASTGNCSAVGGYDDALGDSQGLLVNEVHGSWRGAIEARAPAGAATEPFKLSDGGGLADISCAAAGDCSAIGRYTDAHRLDHGVLFSEVHGVWGRGVALRLPVNAVTPPKPKSSTSAVATLGLAEVSCGSPGSCVAVGNYETNAEVWDALIAVERHGQWSRAIAAPLPAGAPIAGQNAVLLTVTCNRAGQCSAAGEYVDPSGHQQSLLVSGSGDSWSVAPAPAAPSDANSDPNIIPSSIACAGSGECAAVGTYINPLQNSLGLLLDETGGQWAGGTGATLPADAAPAGTVGDQTVVLSSVACPQAGSCTAVGWYFDNDENGQGLLLTQNAGIWQPGVEVTLPTNAVNGLEKQSAGLDSISCASLGNCLATGVYTDIGYNSQGLLLSDVNGVWQTGRESPLPSNAGDLQYAAADQSDCTAAGDCTVIGQYNDRKGDVLGYMLSEQGDTWGTATELQLPPVSVAEARLSLQAILVPPVHSARLAQVRSARGYDYTYQAVEAGTARSAWYASGAGARVLIADGTARVGAATRVQLRMHLTAAGRRLLAGTGTGTKTKTETEANAKAKGKAKAKAAAGHLRVSVVAAFKPRGHGRAVAATAGFTLS